MELQINKLFRESKPFHNKKLADYINGLNEDGTFNKDNGPLSIICVDIFDTTIFDYKTKSERDDDWALLKSCATKCNLIKKMTLKIARYVTDEPDVLERDLKKAGTLTSMRYVDDFLWIMPVIKKLEDDGFAFVFDKNGCSVLAPSAVPIVTIDKSEKLETTFFWAAVVALNYSKSLEDDKPKVIVTIENGVTKLMHNIPDLKTVVLDFDVEDINVSELLAIKIPNQTTKSAFIGNSANALVENSDTQFIWKQIFDLDKKEPVIIELTSNGLFSLYAESGQTVEADFESQDQAEDWAIDNNYRIVDTFHI